MNEPAARQTGDATAAKPLRADARRNRARVLEVATAAFTTEGLSVQIDEIARRAGLGVGTVYRHFPTKEALFEAIVLSWIEELVADARERTEHPDAEQAFFGFFRLMIDRAAANKALVAALTGAGFDLDAAAAGLAAELMDALGALLANAQRAAVVRADVEVGDVKALITGCLAMQDDQRDLDRVVTIVCDGLRPR